MQIFNGQGLENRIENIHLSVDNDNLKAITLYSGLGFEVVAKKGLLFNFKKESFEY